MPTRPFLIAALLAACTLSLSTRSLAQEESAAPTPAPAAAPVDIGHQVPPGFTTDLPAARAAAKQADRPLLVMFCTPHCPPCNALKRSVLPRPEVRANLAEYELAYVNAEASPATAREFKISSYPSFVLLTPAGRELGRTGGGSDNPATFLDSMEKLRHRHERQAGITAAIAKNPQDPALLVARARLLLDAADNSGRPAALIQKAAADLQAAAALDPEGKTGAAAELAWTAIEKRAYQPMTPEEYKANGAEALALWKAHPELRRADLVLWHAISGVPEQEANRLRLEFVRRYPQSPQADQIWSALGKALEKQ